MVHNTYLFFDCECANCFDGKGKICSLGYVLTDDEFNIIEKQDLVINPHCEFDWYLFSPKNNCKLAYSKEFFRSQPDFESYYKDIKKLFTTGNRKVFGFAVDGDVSFVNVACERINLPYIQFSAFDVQKALTQVYSKKMKLSEWTAFLGIDDSELQAHKSVCDAEMTMLCMKELCKKLNCSGDELYKKYKNFTVSYDYMIQVLEEREIKRELKAKIEKIQNKKNPFPKSEEFAGIHFEFDREVFHNLEKAYDLMKLIYDAGGIVSPHISGSGFLLVKHDINEERKQKIEKRGIKIITVKELKNKLGR